MKTVDKERMPGQNCMPADMHQDRKQIVQKCSKFLEEDTHFQFFVNSPVNIGKWEENLTRIYQAFSHLDLGSRGGGAQ